jgi:hypothetical protein
LPSNTALATRRTRVTIAMTHSGTARMLPTAEPDAPTAEAGAAYTPTSGARFADIAPADMLDQTLEPETARAHRLGP